MTISYMQLDLQQKVRYQRRREARRHTALPILQARLLECAGSFSDEQICDVAWAARYTGHGPDELTAALLAAIEERKHPVAPDVAASVFAAAARAKQRGDGGNVSDAFAAALRRTVQQPPESWSARSVATTAWAVVHMGAPRRFLMKQFAAALLLRTDKATPTDLSLMLWSLAKSGSINSAPGRALLRFVCACILGCKAQKPDEILKFHTALLQKQATDPAQQALKNADAAAADPNQAARSVWEHNKGASSRPRKKFAERLAMADFSQLMFALETAFDAAVKAGYPEWAMWVDVPDRKHTLLRKALPDVAVAATVHRLMATMQPRLRHFQVLCFLP